MREYAKNYRPTLVILENVSGAPWNHAKVMEKKKKANATKKQLREQGIDYLMGEVGYSTKFVKMDTKDYYLPQTRQRGYMVCVDRFAYMPEGFNRDEWLSKWETVPLEGALPADIQKEVDKVLDDWYKIVLGLKRKASVPVEMLLLRSDDPVLGQFATDYELHPSKKPTPWESCKIGHFQYRAQYGFGHKREYTGWSEGGAFVPEDFWKRNPKGMVERVLDTIDIGHLRNIDRGFDDRFYK